jgi:hypothetical protein
MLESWRLCKVIAAYSIGLSVFLIKTVPESLPDVGRGAPAGG